MEAKLVVIGGKANMGEVKLRLPMTIGRGHKADLLISHPTVSREHCRLFEKNGELVIQDNGSSNGTFVDGEKITKPMVVHPGQILAIGPLTFRAEYEGPTARTVARKQAGELADTQAIDQDELDLDFLLDDEPAAKPVPAKPKADKRTVEAKAPAAPEKKAAEKKPVEKKAVEQPAAKSAPPQGPSKGPQIGPPPDGVKETSEIDVDFLLDDVAEERQQAPAAKDASEIDFSELDFGEPEVKTPEPAAPKKPEAKKPVAPKKPEEFEQTIDFSAPSEPLAEEVPPLLDDLLPSGEAKGDLDFDFLSDLNDAPVAEVPAIEKSKAPSAAKRPVPKADEIVPPAEPAATAESSAPALDDEADLNAMFGAEEAVAESPAGPSASAAPPATTPEPAAAAEEAPTIETGSPAIEPELDDFLSDLVLDAAPMAEAAAPPDIAESDLPSQATAESVVGPAAELSGEEFAKIRPQIDSDKAAAEQTPDFDFTAVEETQELAKRSLTPEAIPEQPTVPAVDEVAFDFLMEEAATTARAETADAASTEPVEFPASPAAETSEPLAEAKTGTEIDFGFLDIDASAEKVEAPPAETSPAEDEPQDFAIDQGSVPQLQLTLESHATAPLETQAEPEKSPAAKAADEFDFLSDLNVEAAVPRTPAGEPSTEKAAEAAEPVAESLDATLQFDAVSEASVPSKKAPMFMPEAREPSAEQSPSDAVDEFDFLAELNVEPTAEAPTRPDTAVTEPVAAAPETKAESKAIDEACDFLAGAEASPAAKSAEAGDATALFSAGDATEPNPPPAAEAKRDEIEPSWDFDAVEPSLTADELSPAVSAEAETEMFSGLNAQQAVDIPAAEVTAADSTPPEATVEEPAAPNFDVAAKAPDEAPIKPSTKPAVKGPSFFEKIKMLFAGSKGAVKPTSTKKAVKAAPAAASALPSKPTYAPVVPLPTAREDAPIPLDDSPIPFDDLSPSTGEPAANIEATLIGAPSATGEEATTMFPTAGDEFAVAGESTATVDNAKDDEFQIAVAASPAAPTLASDMSPAAVSDTAGPSEPSSTTESPAVADAAAFETAVDPLERDLLGEEAALSDAPVAEMPAAEVSAEETPSTTNETPADDFEPFIAADLGAMSPAEPVAAEPPANPADIATRAPSPAAPRRPASVDIDLRMTSSLRPLSALNVRRPPIDTPQMEPDEPAGRSFAPRAKQPTAPQAESPNVPDAQAFDMSMGDAPAADVPAAELSATAGSTEPSGAELRDSDFDFLAKEREAEASLDAVTSSPTFDAPTEEASHVELPADEAFFAETSSSETAAPAEVPPAGDEEFVLMLDDVELSPGDEPTADSTALAASEESSFANDLVAQTSAVTTNEIDLGFLDLEVAEPASGAGSAEPPSGEAAPKSEEQKRDQPAAKPEPVAVKKTGDDDAELADFLRDLGMG